MKKQNKILALMVVGFLVAATQAHAEDGDEKSGLGPQPASKQNCKDVLKAVQQAKGNFAPNAPAATDPADSKGVQ